ncbi:MAG: 50S ribosomal protein L4 [Patescibacteria group bacterium]
MDPIRSKKSKISADLLKTSLTSNGMDAAVYSVEGKKAGEIKLPENVFGVRWNADLVKQVADSLMSSKRKPVAHTKNRGEVRGGGKKPWQQKGTGRARHGSIRSPLWIGGGVTHGPRKEKSYERTVTKNMRAKALHTLLAQKYREGEVMFIDSLTLKEPKTKRAISALSSLSGVKGFENVFTKRNNATAIALSGKNKETERAFRNLGNVLVLEARNLDPLTLLKYKYLILENPEASLKLIPKLHGKS